MSEIYLRNRQRTRAIQLPLLKSIAAALATRFWGDDFELGVVLVSDPEMTRLNEEFLRHAGSTDVLAFGYDSNQSEGFQGEIFICVDEALRQAQRYGTTWEKEITRYLIHGMLHFQGYVDSRKAARVRMKKVEAALLEWIGEQFCLSQLCRKARVRE